MLEHIEDQVSLSKTSLRHCRYNFQIHSASQRRTGSNSNETWAEKEREQSEM